MYLEPYVMRHVFVDESCQNAHHYMVLGALVVPGALVRQLERQIGELLERHKLDRSEVKWGKLRNASSACYRALVDMHFDEFCANGVEFHALVIDCHALDNRCYHQGDADLAFNRFLYTLLHHRVGLRFGHDETIVVDLDARTTGRGPLELQQILNLGIGKAKGGYLEPPFKRIAHRDSTSSRLLQLSDVLAGSVAWHKNDHDARLGASAAKVEFANYVAERAGLRRLGASSPRRETRLSVWNLALRGRGAR